MARKFLTAGFMAILLLASGCSTTSVTVSQQATTLPDGRVKLETTVLEPVGEDAGISIPLVCYYIYQDDGTVIVIDAKGGEEQYQMKQQCEKINWHERKP